MYRFKGPLVMNNSKYVFFNKEAPFQNGRWFDTGDFRGFFSTYEYPDPTGTLFRL